MLERASPDRFLQDALGAGVCSGEDLETIGIRHLGWHESPTHHHHLPFTCFGVRSNDGLESAGCDVVVGRQLEVGRKLADFEGLGNALFVGSAVVVA
jgi:hypothetical protein